MGAPITVNEFPISQVFVDYVVTVIDEGRIEDSKWHRQRSGASSTQHAGALLQAWAIDRVAAVWQRVGLAFPRDEVLEAW